jgi:hypothetical protein
VLDNMADVEEGHRDEILNDLLRPEVDIVRYRLGFPDTDKGDMCLSSGG